MKAIYIPVKIRTSIFSVPHSHRIRRIIESLTEVYPGYYNDIMFSNPVPKEYKIKLISKRNIDDLTHSATLPQVVSAVIIMRGEIFAAGPDDKIEELSDLLLKSLGKTVNNNKIDLTVLGNPEQYELNINLPMPWNVLVVPKKPDKAPGGREAVPYRARGNEIDIRICSTGRCSWVPAVYYKKIPYNDTIPTPFGPAVNIPLPFEGAKSWLMYLNAAKTYAEKISKGEIKTIPSRRCHSAKKEEKKGDQK